MGPVDAAFLAAKPFLSSTAALAALPMTINGVRQVMGSFPEDAPGTPFLGGNTGLSGIIGAPIRTYSSGMMGSWLGLVPSLLSQKFGINIGSGDAVRDMLIGSGLGMLYGLGREAFSKDPGGWQPEK